VSAGRDRDQRAVQARPDTPVGDGDQRDAAERDSGADPERARKVLQAKRERDQPDEDRRRAEQQADRRRMRELQAVDEAELVQEDHQRGEKDEP